MLVDTTGDALVISAQEQMDARGALRHLEVHPFVSTVQQTLLLDRVCVWDAGCIIVTAVEQRPAGRWVPLNMGAQLDFCIF